MKFLVWFLTLFTLLISFSANSQLKERDKVHITTVNLLTNPGFESGTGKWSKTGSSTLAKDKTTELFGFVSADWDASATGEFLKSELVNARGLKNKVCEALIDYQFVGNLGDLKFLVQDELDNPVASVDIAPTSGTDVASAQLIFDCLDPGTKTMRLAIESTADAASIKLDRAYLGPSFSVGATGAKTPICTVIASTKTADFEDYMLADGRQISRTDFAEYFSSCGTVFGTGDGSTTVHLPDLRGRFIRGVANGSTADPDRATRTAMNTGGATGDNVGSLQGDAIDSHTHSDTFATNSTGAHTHGLGGGSTTNDFLGGASSSASGIIASGSQQTTTLSGGTHSHTVTGSVGNVSGATTSASDTRPVNAYLNYFIKVKGSTAGQTVTLTTTDFWAKGNIDGATVGLSLGDVAEFVANTVSNASLSLSNKEGHDSIKIACNGSNPSTGDTCSVGSEVFGVTFEPDTLGRYEVCLGFPHISDTSSTGRSIVDFKILEVTDGTSTILREGVKGVRLDNGGDVNGVISGVPVEICEEFVIDTASKRNFQISYTHEATATVQTNTLVTDGPIAGDRTREGYYQIKKIGEQKPTPILVDIQNDLDTKAEALGSYTGPPIVKALTCTTSATPTIAADPFNDGAAVVSGGGAGTCQWNFGTVFSSTPVCVAQQAGSTGNRNCTISTTLNTHVIVRTRDPSTGTLDPQTCAIICFGL